MGGRAARAPGRPRVRVLDRSRITAAAVALTSELGPERLTLSRLADDLGVTPAALYNHAASKQVILCWVEDHLMSLIDLSGLDAPDWATALTSWARSYRDVMAAHDGLVEAIAKTPVTDAPTTLAMYEAVARRLRRAGWPADEVVPAIVAIESFVYGSAYDVSAPADIFAVRDPDEAPAFAAAVTAHDRRVAAARVASADAVFASGLAALLSGLAGRAGVSAGPA